jgi:outer membrane lipoprotein-sorting protein
MKKTAVLFLFLLQLFQAEGQLPDAAQIMERTRDLTLTGSMQATVSLTITEKNGSTRNRTISITTKSYDKGQEKRLIRFIEPADVRGTGMLIVDNQNSVDEMWIYLPALKKVRRIVLSEKGKSFMSSEFTNADISSPPVSDFTHRHLEKSGTNNMWIIESTPASDDIADNYGYSRKVSYISMDKTRPLKMEFYNFDNVLFKTIEIKSILPLADGKFLVKDMLATNLSNSRKSEILFSKINEGLKIDDGFFSVQRLEQ